MRRDPAFQGTGSIADDIEIDLSAIDTVGEAARLFVEVYGADAAWWRASVLADRAQLAMDHHNQLFWSIVLDEIRAMGNVTVLD